MALWLWLILGCLALLIALWALLTQPLLLPVKRNENMPAVDPTRLESHVRLLSESFIPRDEGHPENLDRVAAYIKAKFEQARGNISEQVYQVSGRTYRNVIALFGPETRERIVIGAHYDAAGEMPAADDNASGVAGLIELAYLLGQTRLPLQVELVAYTLEEPPYFRTAAMGSAVHATSLKEHGVPVRLMVSLEMIGYFSDAPKSQEFPLDILRLFYPSQGNFIAVVGKFNQGSITRRVKQAMAGASSLPIYSINAPPQIPGVDLSDHLNYWLAGYPAVMVTDTAFYRNRYYHTFWDTSDTLDYRRMAMVVQGVYATILTVAQEV